eukprot:Hpha_TRINITY_DN8485_c0_g1::TRINITY_DN8485_c0_g1_i1::g.34772::m.34772
MGDSADSVTKKSPRRAPGVSPLNLTRRMEGIFPGENCKTPSRRFAIFGTPISKPYSKDGDPSDPKIGDVKVTYRVVEPGAHTILGKYGKAKGPRSAAAAASELELQPYKADLSKSLRDEADLIIPDEAQVLAEKAGLSGAFVIPDWVAELAETFVLAALPLEYAMVERGIYNRDESTAKHGAQSAENTSSMYYVGALMCVFGCHCAAAPVGVVSAGGQLAAGFTSGMSIAHTARKNSRAQAEATAKGQSVKAGKGGADVRI